MIASFIPAEQRSVLPNASWQAVASLLVQSSDARGYRFAYDGSTLETTTPFYEHESYSSQLHHLILILAEELNISIQAGCSAVLLHQERHRAIEPDNCYYIKNAAVAKKQPIIDLTMTPPPDLAIEIDITSTAIDKLSLYAALGVPELWHYDGVEARFYRLQGQKYCECGRTGCQEDIRSGVFPLILAPTISRFVEQSKVLGEPAANRSFRTWLRNHLADYRDRLSSRGAGEQGSKGVIDSTDSRSK